MKTQKATPHSAHIGILRGICLSVYLWNVDSAGFWSLKRWLSMDQNTFLRFMVRNSRRIYYGSFVHFRYNSEGNVKSFFLQFYWKKGPCDLIWIFFYFRMFILEINFYLKCSKIDIKFLNVLRLKPVRYTQSKTKTQQCFLLVVFMR